MEKGKKIQIIIICVCTFLVIALCGFLIYKHNKKGVETDAIKFKNEYESYNEVDNGQGSTFPSVDIPEENPIVYKTPREIVDILKEEDAIVYFGFASCPWCRNIVETLIKASKDNNISKVYYVDIKNIRDSYEFTGSIKLTQTKKGVDAYYEILDFFGDKLEDYYITGSDGNQYGAGVTRLYAPTVVSVSDGEIKGMHVATVEGHENPYEKINEEQIKKLYDIYVDLIKKISK